MSTLTKEHLYTKLPSFTIYFSLTYFNIEKHIETLEAMLCGMCTGEVYINVHIKNSNKKNRFMNPIHLFWSVVKEVSIS